MNYFKVEKGITNSRKNYNAFSNEIAKNLLDAMEEKPKSLTFTVTYSYVMCDCMGPTWSHTKDIVCVKKDIVLSQINWEVLTKDAIECGHATAKIFCF